MTYNTINKAQTNQLINKKYYTIQDGEALNKLYPDTFYIPPKKVRNNLKSGTLVKMTIDGRDDFSSDRVWVIVIGKKNDVYIGKLDNHISNELPWGGIIKFKAKHVINLDS